MEGGRELVNFVSCLAFCKKLNCNRKNTTACSFQSRKMWVTSPVPAQLLPIFTPTWVKYSPHSLRPEHVSRSSSSPRGRASTTLTHYISHNDSSDATSNNVAPGFKSQHFWYAVPRSSSKLAKQEDTRNASYLTVSRSLNSGLHKFSVKISRSHLKILADRKVT